LFFSARGDCIADTDTVTEVEVLGLELASPEYDATMLSLPTGSDDVVSIAVPPDIVTGEPKLVPLRRNCIVPVAVLGVTVALNVTD
jgi:hypothetical protein